MALSIRMFAAGAAVLLAAAYVSDASAAGRPGLWNITTTTSMAGAQMPQMPQMTPAQRAQMEALGIRMPAFGQPRSAQRCVTPEEAAQDRPPRLDQEMNNCQMQNLVVDGASMSADLVCTGENQGTGRIEFSYDSDTHYAGQVSFNGMRNGQAMSMTNTMEGNWLSADCGAAGQ